MNTLRSAAATELRRILRTPATLLLLLALIGLYPVLISWLYTTNSEVERPALVVDEDHSAASRELALALHATQGLSVQRFDATLDEAQAALRASAVELVVLIPADYGADLARGQRTAVKAWSDSANMLTYSVGAGALGDTVADLGRAHGERAWARTLPRDLAAARADPIQVDVRVLHTPARGYGDFLVPAIFIIVMQQLVLLGMAFSASATRERGGALPQSLPGWLGFALPHAAVQLLGAGVLALTAHHFGWPLRNPTAWLALAAAFALALLPLGALLASLARDRATTMAGLLFTSVPSLLLSGYVWPRDQMPDAAALIGGAMPSTPALEGLQRVAFEGAGLAEILPALEHLAVIFAAGLALLTLRLLLRKPHHRAAFEASP